MSETLDRIKAIIGEEEREDPRLTLARDEVAKSLKGRVAPDVEHALVDAQYAQRRGRTVGTATDRLLAAGIATPFPVSRRAYR